MLRLSVALIAAVLTACAAPQTLPAPSASAAEVLTKASAADWRDLDPDRTLVLDSPAGRVVVELAPRFAPVHVANITTLANTGFWDGTAVVRVHDNYVVQWGDPTEKKELGPIVRDPPPEYHVAAGQVPFTPLPDGDVYAAQVGWTDGMPVARDATNTQTWMVHCYGVVGVGRDMPPNTGTGAELYAVIGHAPRHLDRNLALVGRVVAGLENWTALPRGKGQLGFYETESQRTPITRARLASALPQADRPKIQVLRTDTATWAAWVNARRHRREPFFVEAAGRVDLCNVTIPTRIRP